MMNKSMKLQVEEEYYKKMTLSMLGIPKVEVLCKGMELLFCGDWL